MYVPLILPQTPSTGAGNTTTSPVHDCVTHHEYGWTTVPVTVYVPEFVYECVHVSVHDNKADRVPHHHRLICHVCAHVFHDSVAKT